MTEGDDSTIYLHITEDDGSHPEMVLADFAQLIKASQQHSPPSVPRFFILLMLLSNNALSQDQKRKTTMKTKGFEKREDKTYEIQKDSYLHI